MEEGGSLSFAVGTRAELSPSIGGPGASSHSSAPTNDVSPPMRQGRFSPPPPEHQALRGPRAPSGSTNTSTSASRPSLVFYDASLDDRRSTPNPPPPASPSVTFASPSRTPGDGETLQQSRPLPPPAPSSTKQSLDASRASAASVATGRESFRPDQGQEPDQSTQSPRFQPLQGIPSTSSAVDTLPASSNLPPPSSPPDILRRPTPRYASVLTAPVQRGAVGSVDELGRMSTSVPASTSVKREDSFVAKMSQKWGADRDAGGSEDSGARKRDSSGQSIVRLTFASRSVEMATDRCSVAQAPLLTHARSDSRVQLLAKRYSAPPKPISTSTSSFRPLSPEGPLSPTSPIMSAVRRPLPAPTGHHQSGSVQLSMSSSSFDATTAPNRPQFGSSSSYGPPPVAPPQTAPLHRASQDFDRRRRAYETASPLPPAEEDEEDSGEAERGKGTARASPLSPSQPQSQTAFPTPRLSTSPQPSSYPATFSPHSDRFVPPSQTGSIIDAGGLTHSRLCGCASCAEEKYGAGSGAGGGGGVRTESSREEEERLQRALRREKEGGTWRGVLARAL